MIFIQMLHLSLDILQLLFLIRRGPLELRVELIIGFFELFLKVLDNHSVLCLALSVVVCHQLNLFFLFLQFFSKFSIFLG